jgi:hypothetical protein
MRKYIVLFCTLVYIGLSIYQLYYAYALKVGLIGNGPNEKVIWFNFIILMIGDIAFATITIRIAEEQKTDLLPFL